MLFYAHDFSSIISLFWYINTLKKSFYDDPVEQAVKNVLGSTKDTISNSYDRIEDM